jgi:hypothetical protein
VQRDVWDGRAGISKRGGGRNPGVTPGIFRKKRTYFCKSEKEGKKAKYRY